MKKLLLIGVLFIAQVAISQNNSEEKETTNKSEISEKKQQIWNFGADLGVNFNHFNRAGNDLGFQIGGLVQYKFNDYYFFSSGVSYSQIGGQEIDRTIISIPGSAVIQRDILNRSVRMHSVEVPFKIHLTHPSSKGKLITPDLFVGMAYNAVLMVNERRDELWYSNALTPVGDPVKSLLTNRNEDVTSSYNTHLFSAVVGSNLYIKITENFSYLIGVEYKMGLQDVKENPYPYGGNMKMSQFNLKIGVLF